MSKSDPQGERLLRSRAYIVQVFRTRNFVPVVDKATGKLAGMISTWDTLAKVRESR